MKEPRKFLGIELIRDRKSKTIFIHQKSFVEKMLITFKMENCNATKTPYISSDCIKRGENRRF